MENEQNANLFKCFLEIMKIGCFPCVGENGVITILSTNNQDEKLKKLAERFNYKPYFSFGCCFEGLDEIGFYPQSILTPDEEIKQNELALIKRKEEFNLKFPTLESYLTYIKEVIGDDDYNFYFNDGMGKYLFEVSYNDCLTDKDKIIMVLENIPPF